MELPEHRLDGVAGIFVSQDGAEPMLTTERYVTHDLWEAAFLRSRGAHLTGTTRQGNRVIFEFKGREVCERLGNEYLNNGQVDISSLKAAWHDLKSLIFDR